MGPHNIDKVRAILAIRSHAPKRVVRVKAIRMRPSPTFRANYVTVADRPLFPLIRPDLSPN